MVIVVFVVAVAVVAEALQSQEERKLAKRLRPKEQRNKQQSLRGTCNIFGILQRQPGNLHCGDRTSHFPWHLRHLEDKSFHAAWYLQDFARSSCSILEFQPSILHGDFPFW